MEAVPLWAVGVLAFVTAGVGALGGLGGAVLLVPALVLLGLSPHEAAPLGMVSVAAGSVAAGAAQLRTGLVHHRLGVVTETTATAGAVLGALLSTAVAPTLLVRLLGASALAAALLGLSRRGMRNLPSPAFAAEQPGEWPGTLGGTYRAPGGVVPYATRRLPAGLALMGGAGLVSGLVGVGGGFVKTPVTSEVMRVPVKVAAATSTFTVGITAAAALVVFSTQGRVDPVASAAVVAAGIVGGAVGAAVQDRLRPPVVRRVVGVLLLGIGLLFLVRG